MSENELLTEGYVETNPSLLLKLIDYALDDPIVAATELAVHTQFCRVKIVEPDILFLQFNIRFGLWARVKREDIERIKEAYIDLNHEVERIRELN